MNPRLPIAFAAVVLAASFFGAAACSRPLPEPESHAAKLYVQVCGGCHRMYHPSVLTPDMWRLQVDRMDAKYREANRPVPEGAERAEILDYLTRHAGG